LKNPENGTLYVIIFSSAITRIKARTMPGGWLMENLIRAGEVAVMVDVSIQTIYRYVMNKEIPFYKLGRAVRFSRAEVSEWLDGRKKGRAASLNEKPDESCAVQPDLQGCENADGAETAGN
jgi:excisionase family DNA binding protein